MQQAAAGRPQAALVSEFNAAVAAKEREFSALVKVGRWRPAGVLAGGWRLAGVLAGGWRAGWWLAGALHWWGRLAGGGPGGPAAQRG
jgi:hypothetical protein